MLTLPTIQRCHRTRDHERLLRALQDNGLMLPLPLRVRLSSLPTAVTALGLRRVVELSYGPTPLSREMLAGLLAWWQGCGPRGRGCSPVGPSASAPDPLAVAAFAAALSLVLEEHPRLNHPALQLAKREALAALADTQAEDGLFEAEDDRTNLDRHHTAAFIHSLLDREEVYHALVRVSDLAEALADAAAPDTSVTTVRSRHAQLALAA